MKTSVALCAVLVMFGVGCDRAGSPPLIGEARSRDGAPATARADQPKAAAFAAQPSAVHGDDVGTDSLAVDGQQIAPSMLIRTADVSVEVGALDTGITRVRALAQRVGGYVADVSVRQGSAQPRSATLSVRVPAARFDDALTGLRPLGTLESVNVSTADVSEEYVDVNARMENARQLESRLLTLLATRTGKLSDVLAVERELSNVREVIERYEGRIRYLRTRAAVSTIAVTVHEPVPLVGERGSGSELADAFRQAWRNFVGLIAAAIASLGVLVPLGVVGAALVVTVRRLGIKRVVASGKPPEAPAGA